MTVPRCRRFFLTLSGLAAWAVLCLCTTLLQAQPVRASGLQPVTLQLHWTHEFEFAGFYVAKEKGFYAERGLDVTIIPGGPGIVPVQEVLRGNAQYGIGAAEVLLARLRGAPLVMLAAVFQHSASCILTRADSGIYTPQDLVGRVFEMGRLESDAETYAMLHNEGIDISQLTHVDSTFNPQLLLDGKVDAISAYSFSQPFFLRERGIPYRLIRPIQYGIDFYGNSIFSSENEVRRHPERTEAFIEASMKGWAYAFDHVDEAVDIILNKYSDHPFAHSREHLLFEAEESRKLVMPHLVDLGHMNPGRWKHMADTLVQLGLADADYTLKGFLHDPDLSSSLLAHWGVRAGIGILAGAVGLCLVLLRFNRRLTAEIASRRKAEERTLRSEQRLSLALWAGNLGWWDWDLKSDHVSLDRTAHTMLGGSDTPLQTALESMAGNRSLTGAMPFVHTLRNMQQNDTRTFEEEMQLDTGGKKRWVLCRGQMINSSGRAAGVLMDISKLKSYQQELEQMTMTDYLTGLFNRRHFFRQLETHLEQYKRRQYNLCVALLDLDHFKRINDTYGHMAGDSVIREFALLLKESLRPYDVVARFGGEEFIILLLDSGREEALGILDRLLKKVSGHTFDAEGHHLRVTFSGGIAEADELPASELTPKRIVAAADQRLYLAKTAGRNTIRIR
ncbi:diguanylate cyclase [Oleidesulfovibrio alaskensis G20]|jgi:diguanylate cyclase (GGDEF)-like protein|uniref:diguanylate cyclase n=1 Tax=Oleidesulfovibrio alaskensis (strain ATCC BAA-1058 / DSM 17464 / G20) TaxID=207559 RepID=Q313C4_OLEA2|nr:diguanylate cyclase [Oleidesulfovibrio alaskensis]ABB37972.1 diguanylate cyclase [Oleidesulfovibrio alaskensis G20]MBG0772883.1 diguanylate cyclase [Oleidesulfovibrio alaskensis]MBL3582561.1 diguanylate cyclase [Oleidesulfovibrio alaskensis]